MSTLINRKKEKVKNVVDRVGTENLTEENFIQTYKQLYPSDWERIVAKYNEEEASTPPGKKHPMPPPEMYMKNMYRNQVVSPARKPSIYNPPSLPAWK